MKIGKCTALALSLAFSASIIAGCNSNKPTAESSARTTPPITSSQPVLPATATPEQQASAQAQDQLNRAAAAAMFKMQEDRIKSTGKK
jgi:hypothetical protein